MGSYYIYTHICILDIMAIYKADDVCKVLTVKCSRILLCTPHPTSVTSFCSHPNFIYNPSIQLRQKGSSCKRCGVYLTAPGFSHISFELNLVLRDVYITLRNSPRHPQTWFPFPHCLEQRNASYLRRDWQRVKRR